MHGVVADDVVHVAVQQDVGVQRDVHLGQRGADVLLRVQVDAAEFGFDLLRAGLGEVNVAAVRVGVVVVAGDQFAYQPDDFELRGLPVRGAREHERDQRLVDEHRIGLVDQRHVGVRRHQVVDVGDELVAQHVEPDLVDRGVGDVALVGGAALVGGRVRGDPADGQPHRFQQRAHPFGVALGQVVVDGDDVHVPAGERVTGGRDRAGQRLALAGGHLDDVACQHPQRAEQLDVERTQPGRAFGGLAGDREELRNVLRLGEILEVQQLGGLLQLLVVEAGGLRVELLGGADLRHRAGLVPVGAGAEQLPEPVADTT